ncbi:MAG TPA: hypothetical protein VHX65_05785 [Pirellulales bacterium]|nr:hypothetical protein [Pirellulales bacterium]
MKIDESALAANVRSDFPVNWVAENQSVWISEDHRPKPTFPIFASVGHGHVVNDFARSAASAFEFWGQASVAQIVGLSAG